MAGATFEQRITAGEYREQLEAVRDVLAERLGCAEPRESAALARQLTDVCTRLEQMTPVERSTVDDLAGRRQKRRAQVQKRARSTKRSGSGSG